MKPCAVLLCELARPLHTPVVVITVIAMSGFVMLFIVLLLLFEIYVIGIVFFNTLFLDNFGHGFRLCSRRGLPKGAAIDIFFQHLSP